MRPDGKTDLPSLDQTLTPEASPDLPPPDQMVLPPDLGIVCNKLVDDYKSSGKTTLNGTLCVPKGTTYTMSGKNIYKSVIIEGTVVVEGYDPKTSTGGILELVADNIIVGVSGKIDGTGKGNPAGKGAGKGGLMGGGGYATKGKGAGGGSIYGTDCLSDITMGSGGSCLSGSSFPGSGGAQITLDGGTISHNGIIICDGGLPTPQKPCCPGSGGGILFKAKYHLMGKGKIFALGGKSTHCPGGDGRYKFKLGSGATDTSLYKIDVGKGSNCKI